MSLLGPRLPDILDACHPDTGTGVGRFSDEPAFGSTKSGEAWFRSTSIVGSDPSIAVTGSSTTIEFDTASGVPSVDGESIKSSIDGSFYLPPFSLLQSSSIEGPDDVAERPVTPSTSIEFDDDTRSFDSTSFFSDSMIPTTLSSTIEGGDEVSPETNCESTSPSFETLDHGSFGSKLTPGLGSTPFSPDF